MKTTGEHGAEHATLRSRGRAPAAATNRKRFDRRVTVLGGGVGAAKFLRGLVRVMDPARLCVVVNTADDEEFFGLHVSPDIDTVTYTLARVSHPLRGWGRARDTFLCLEELGRFYGRPWFKLGDRDLATHIFRSQQLAAGMTLSAVTARVARAFGVRAKVLPMTDGCVRTVVGTAQGSMSFQEYFVKHRARPAVESIMYRGARTANPAPGVLANIMRADVVIVAPSNPVVSVGPILALPGIRQALLRTKAAVAAVSPIIGRSAVTGPAARMMKALGFPASAIGVAALYRPFLDLLLIDRQDRRHARAIEETGAHALVTDIMIPTTSRAAILARHLLESLLAAGMLSRRGPRADKDPAHPRYPRHRAR